MNIIYNNIIPFKGFCVMNLFGVLFARKNCRINNYVLNHEAIHSAQMKELGYILFYIIYALEWLFYKIKGKTNLEAYRNIKFEKEAYFNETDMSYLSVRKKFNWRKY